MERTAGTADKPFKVAVIGAIANPNMGDEAILEENLRLIEHMYDGNCVIYVFTKDAAYTARNTLSPCVIPTDCLHRITKACYYVPDIMRPEHEKVLAYAPGTGENALYEELHRILSTVKVVHVIGGGYLNSLWPDMLEEVLLVTRLAKRYGTRTIVTGIGTFPIDEPWLTDLREVLDGSECADFRDSSLEIVRASCTTESLPLQQTIDDAVTFGLRAPESWKKQIPDSVLKLTPGRYLNFSLHPGSDPLEPEIPEEIEPVEQVEPGEASELGASEPLPEPEPEPEPEPNENYLTWAELEGVPERLLTWAQTLIDQQLIEEVNILLFSEDEMHLWEELVGTGRFPKSRYHLIDITEMHPYAVQQLIARARYNVGSRYHQAVFSLASDVPALSISVTPYYRFKLDSIHETFSSNAVVDLADLTEDMLRSFTEGAPKEHRRLHLNRSNVKAVYERKLRAIAAAYAGDQGDAETLFQRAFAPLSDETAEGDPVVSVICPLYNAQSTIKAQLNNLLGQTLTNIEVICVDAGSTDDTSSVLCEYAWHDRRVRLLHLPHTKHAQARDYGLEAARGAYVLFMEQGTTLASNSALAMLYHAICEHGVPISAGMLVGEDAFPEETTWGMEPISIEELRELYITPPPPPVEPEFFEELIEEPLDPEDIPLPPPMDLPAYPVGLSSAASWLGFAPLGSFLFDRSLLTSNGLSLDGGDTLSDELWLAQTLLQVEHFCVIEAPVVELPDSTSRKALTQDETIKVLEHATTLIQFAHSHGLSQLMDETLHALLHDISPLIAPCLDRTRPAPQLDRALDEFGAACVDAGIYKNPSTATRAILSRSRDVSAEEFVQKMQELDATHAAECAELAAALQETMAANEEALALKAEEFESSRTWKIGHAVNWLPNALHNLFAKDADQ